MIKLWLRFLKWFSSCGIMLWFVLTPLLPLYGWFAPWPAAEIGLRAQGIDGTLLLFGSSFSSSRVGSTWKEERQRTYVVFPHSLLRRELYAYTERKGSEITGVQGSVTRSHTFVLFLAIWIVAGVFSARIVMPWAKNKNLTSRNEQA
jgi:hypothetical protein